MKPKRYGPFPYSPIIDRPKKRWPNGARIAVWVIPNIEFFALNEQIPAAAGGGGQVPDVSTWSSRDYGNRIGIYRMMEVMKRHGVRGTVALNSELTVEHPRIMEECAKLHWELMGHNESNTRRLNSVSDAEASLIVKRTVQTIHQNTGQKVKGWLSSGLAETWNSLDDLVDNGVEYVADWVNDDQPYKMTLDDGRSIMSIPYSTELNDKPAYEKKFMTPDQFEAMICRQFDVLWKEGAEQARAMGIALHPYLTGVPHRIGALDAALAYIAKHEGVWFATGSEIAQAGQSL
jgi:peptidoglycan/xylan/chitin deacetylase (PgdA/CDA1 family)